MFKYCPYEKVRSPSQARAAVWHRVPSGSLPLHQPEALSHGWMGLLQHGLGGKGTCHICQMCLAHKAGKGGNGDQREDHA